MMAKNYQADTALLAHPCKGPGESRLHRFTKPTLNRSDVVN
jgi:hypothetical protein